MFRGAQLYGVDIYFLANLKLPEKKIIALNNLK
jgi:hypothetical protein